LHPELSDAVVELLNRTADERQTKLYAWCLMPDHAHLLTQDPDVVELVRLFKGRATPYARRYDPRRRFWQRSFHDHGLRPDEPIRQVALYVFENPLRAQLVNTVIDYRWSGSNVWRQWRSFYD
jgi:REP element-mobilizing transposase RayT